MAKLLGVMQTIRKTDEMQARGVAFVEEIVGRYPDLVGLAEIVKPAKTIMDKTPVPTTPSQSTVPKEVPTVVDSGTPKLYPSSSINTLGIRIFECPVCESTFRNHATADAHICKEHTKMKYGLCTKCGFTSWNGDSFCAHSKKHKWNFLNFFTQSFVHWHFVISLPYDFPMDVGILFHGTIIWIKNL